MSGIIGHSVGLKSGVIGLPRSKTPSFAVKCTTDEDVNVTNVIFKFNNIISDNYAAFNTTSSNYKYVIPVEGMYQFNYSGRFSAPTGDWRVYELWIQHNESNVIGIGSLTFKDPTNSTDNNHPDISMSGMYPMNVGDRVRVYHATHRSSDAGLHVSANQSWFSGHWVSNE